MRSINQILLIVIFILTFIGCGIKKPKDGLSQPLVLKDGLLYADSTSNIPFTGRNKSKMMDQIIEYDVVNGINEGDFIAYYSNKKIQMIGKMSDNKNVGEWKYFYQDGTMESIGNYKNDKPSGIWKWFSPEGKLIEEGNFIEGKRDGVWKDYDSAGSVTLLRVYEKDFIKDSTVVK